MRESSRSMTSSVCTGSTSTGAPCRRSVKTGTGLCWQHSRGLRRKWRSLTRNQSIVFVLACVGAVSVFISLAAWRFPQFWVATPVAHAPVAAHDPKYVPPRGPLTRVDGDFPAPSELLCAGVSDEVRIACLCPRLVPYSLESLSAPKEDNYAIQVTLTSPREPMYKVRVFLRGMISHAELLDSFPYGPKQSVSVVENLDYDKYSFIVQSSAPQSVFKLRVLSSTGLRLMCANQEN
jgi:hypothetical protein